MRIKKFKDFKKRKKTVLKPFTDKPYSWQPPFNTMSPAPGYQINIVPTKLS